MENIKIIIENLFAYYGKHQVIKNVSLPLYKNKIFSIIGPSGCGKSTLIRCINRLHELSPEGRVEGKIFIDGKNIYSPDIDPIEVRKKVGMVFQFPVIFPTMSVFDNVAIGLKLNGIKNKKMIEEMVISSLEDVGLYSEIKNKLFSLGHHLSGGQQQRLCLARSLALKSEIILLDEPCASLDPISTAKIEELLVKLKENHTIVIVTHNIPQAARISDYTAFLLLGELIEFGQTKSIFTAPKDKRTEEYLQGRFG